MLIGWATGRFGLFGVNPEPLQSKVLNDVGVVLAIVSLLLLVSVQPMVAAADADGVVPHGSSKAASVSSSLPEGIRKLSDADEDARVLTSAAHAPPFTSESAPLKLTARLSPVQKRVFGVIASVVAGLLSGSTFAPPQYVVDKTSDWSGTGSPPFPGASTQLLDYLFSHFSGIFLSSTCYMMLYVAVRRNRPWVSAELALPSFLGGVCWGIATVGWFVGNEELSMTIAYPIITIGPGLVSMAIGGIAYKEVAGFRATATIIASTLIYVGASVLIVLSKSAAA